MKANPPLRKPLFPPAPPKLTKQEVSKYHILIIKLTLLCVVNIVSL